MLTIIIPMYNSQRYIIYTIESIINQKYIDQIILIDDCSNDETLNKIKKYLKNKKIKLIKNKKNEGLSKSLNIAAEHVKNDYFVLLGHDDMLDRDFSEGLCDILNKTKFDILILNPYIIDEQGKIRSRQFSNVKIYIKSLFPKLFLKRGNFINSCGVVQRTNFFKSINGWSDKYKIYGEYFYWCKAVKNKCILKYSSKLKSYYRVHETNITKKILKEEKEKLKKYLKECKECLL